MVGSVSQRLFVELPNRVSEFRILGIMHQVLDFYWEKGAGQGAIYLKPHAHAYLKKNNFGMT